MIKIDASVVEKANEIKKEYYFKYNEKATQKLAAIDGLQPLTCFVDENRILFSNKSNNSALSQIIMTDREYNIIDYIDMKKYLPWRPITFSKYKNRYIACGVMDRAGFLEYTPYIFSEDFVSSIALEDEIPFFKNRQITVAVNDDNDGIFFLEPYTGLLHYMDKEDEITSFTGSFKESFQLSYFNKTLYITDLFLWMRLKQSCNVLIFKNKQFEQTNLTAETISYSSKLNCFFTASSFLDTSVKKYSADGSLIFSKDFAFDSLRQQKPKFIAVNNGNLLLIVENSKTPIIYDIY